MAFLGVLESSQNNYVNFQFSCQLKRNMVLGMEIFLSVKIHTLQITMLQQISLALLQYEHRRRSNHEIKRPVLTCANDFSNYEVLSLKIVLIFLYLIFFPRKVILIRYVFV